MLRILFSFAKLMLPQLLSQGSAGVGVWDWLAGLLEQVYL
jgi:hypothetical protein